MTAASGVSRKRPLSQESGVEPAPVTTGKLRIVALVALAAMAIGVATRRGYTVHPSVTPYSAQLIQGGSLLLTYVLGLLFGREAAKSLLKEQGTIITGLKSQLAAAQAAAQKQPDNSKVPAQVEHANRKIKKLADESETDKKTIDKLKIELKAAKLATDDATNRGSKKISELKAELEAAKKTPVAVSSQPAEEEGLSEKLAAAEEAVAAAEKRAEDKDGTLQILAQDFATFKKETGNAAERAATEHKKELDSLNEQLTTAKGEISKKVEALTTLEGEFNSLKNQNSELQRELDAKLAKVDSAKAAFANDLLNAASPQRQQQSGSEVPDKE